MRGAGGTDGGIGSFWFGLLMIFVACWMFFDSVGVGTRGHGGYLGRHYGGLMLITMAPFFFGVFLLFFNSKAKAGWILTVLGIAVIVLEVVSSLRFHMHMKLWQWFIVVICGLGGFGMVARSLRDGSKT